MSKKWGILQKVNCLQTGGSSCQVTSPQRGGGAKAGDLQKGSMPEAQSKIQLPLFLQRLAKG